MDPVWLNSYPETVPKTINPETYTSLVDLLTQACETYADKTAFMQMGSKLSFQDYYTHAKKFAAYLQSQGVQKGDRVALMMPNVLQYPVCLLGSLLVGAIVVNLNPLYTARELAVIFKDAKLKAIVILENFAHVLTRALAKPGVPEIPIVITTQVGDEHALVKRLIVNAVIKYVKKMVPVWDIPHATTYRQALQAGAATTFKPETLTLEDVAFLQYTGGTTGTPKGAMLTHRNIVANILQATAWISPYVTPGDEIIITALPLYHIFSLLANCLTFSHIGGTNVLIINPRDLKAFIKEMKTVPFTAMTGVNTLFNALNHNSEFKNVDTSHLRVTLAGGMPTQAAVSKTWQAITGVPLIEAYGLTEASPAVCINPLDLKAFNGSIGLPIPSTEIKVIDDQGNEMPVGEEGELCVRGPQVMLGYWENPEATAEAFTEDGWLKTGDVAKIDADGFVYLVDRKKDMIIVSGFNVYPTEIEDVIMMHPGVLEAGVVGMPSDASGEVIKAVIVKADDAITMSDIQKHCRENLTSYKVPKLIEFRDELPKTNVGKVLRRALREA